MTSPQRPRAAATPTAPVGVTAELPHDQWLRIKDCFEVGLSHYEMVVIPAELARPFYVFVLAARQEIERLTGEWEDDWAGFIKMRDGYKARAEAAESALAAQAQRRDEVVVALAADQELIDQYQAAWGRDVASHPGVNAARIRFYRARAALITPEPK